MAEILGLIIGIAIGALISGAIIWIVGKLNLGMTVDNFGWAMLAGVVIGLITNVIMRLVSDLGGMIGFLVWIVVAAVVILGAGKLLKGVTVDGFVGALLAALAIAVINYGLAFLIGGLVTTA